MDWSGASALKAEGDTQSGLEEAQDGGPLGARDTTLTTHGSEAPGHTQGNDGASAAGSETVTGHREAASESPRGSSSSSGSGGRGGGASAGGAEAAAGGVGVGVGVGSLRRLGLAPQLAELSLLVTPQARRGGEDDGGEAEDGEEGLEEGEEGGEGYALEGLGAVQGMMQHQQQQQQLRMEDVSQEEYDRAEARLLERVYGIDVYDTGSVGRAGQEGGSEDDEDEEGPYTDDEHAEVGVG